jgi:hypothetical protein
MFVRFYQREPEIHHQEKTPKKWNSGQIRCIDGNHSVIFLFIVSIHYDVVGMLSYLNLLHIGGENSEE